MRNYITTYDPFFDRFFLDGNNCSVSNMMKTDIKEKKDHYEFSIELPDVKKEDIKVSLENGYIKVKASVNNENEEEDYLYRERSYGEYSRTYYVGNKVQLTDISAKLENGILHLTVKKPDEKEIENEHFVQIA